MNVHAQMSGQVPNQQSQQNGNFLVPSAPMQNVASGGVGMITVGSGGGGFAANNGVDPGATRYRYAMREKILAIITQRVVHQDDELQKQKLKEFAERLEWRLFKLASNKEEYMNLDTLESRMSNLLKRSFTTNNNQRQAQMVNPSSANGTMRPTPGISHGGNSSMRTSNVDSVIVSSHESEAYSNCGNITSSNAIHGSLSNGCRSSSANFSVCSGGNFSQRMTSQMIPTPGFGSNNRNNQSFVDVEPSSDSTNSNVEIMLASQPQQQRQSVDSQNNRIVQNVSKLGGNINSLRKPVVANGGVGMMTNNLQSMKDGVAADGHIKGQSLLQNNQYNRQPMQSVSYAADKTGSLRSGSMYGGAASAVSTMNIQNLNSSSTKNWLMTNHSSVQEATGINTPSIDHSNKQAFQLPPWDSLMQPPQQNSFQPHTSQFQNKHFMQHDLHSQLNTPHQKMLSNDSLSRSQLGSNHTLQVKHNSGSDALVTNATEGFHVAETQNLGSQSSLENRCNDEQAPTLPSGHKSSQILVRDPQKSFNCLQVDSFADLMMEGRSQQTNNDSYLAGSIPEQNVKENFLHRINRQDEAQPNNLPADGSIKVQTLTIRAQNSTSSVHPPGSGSRDLQFRRQQMWLLFLLHARGCAYAEGECPSGNPCFMAQKLLKHMHKCISYQVGYYCTFPRCIQSRKLINHFKKCHDMSCPVCVPVKLHGAQSRARAQLCSYASMSTKSSDTTDVSSHLTTNARPGDSLEELQSCAKRMKIEKSSSSVIEDGHTSSDGLGTSQEVQNQQVEESMPVEVTFEPRASTEMTDVEIVDVGMVDCQHTDNVVLVHTISELPKGGNVRDGIHSDLPKQDTEVIDKASGSKSGKPKIKGVSLTELFTPEQVKEHILGLRQWVGQSKTKAEKNQAMEHSMSENSCQLCAVEKLTFEPPPIYCIPCGNRIKRNAFYYTCGAGETRHYFCISCYNDARGDTLVVDGTSIQKSKFERKRNDEETEEWWVQCDKCEAWQHQICALFNGRRNDGGQAEYTCPNCYIAEVESGKRIPLPQNAVLGAKDLPTTILSDHIEQRLFKRLKQERQERARAQGKNIDEVPTADSIVVRVVSSVDKKLDVKPRFFEIFREENYPTEFPYKSKVILLFQKIEGVEVCLFGMYVQEFGSDNQFPNQRRVYLSYLDSVKYFRPDIKTVTGEALRTFVYHEILIGYLEYCKKRGFTSCYIWACPPLKGEDYILYCHPEIQKTPKSDKLREWYLSMLKKATKENIVVDLTNLYDHFFVCAGECRAKVTSARLPYFDGDYWPGAAEDLLLQINQEDDARKQNKKGAIKKTINKRALKASGQTDLSKDLLLMHKLGEIISPMKEDFIMVHLQHCCTHCCALMVSGNRWVCRQCKNFQICDKCHDEERKRVDIERHPINHREKHTLHPVEITDVAEDTKDKDEILESEFFDTRQAFLSLCQGNHYQYDTLRRAKHSSMMVLYHLHNPTAPAFVTTCNVCHLDIEAGQGWRCEVCPDYDVCSACYQENGVSDHPHKLTNHPSVVERDAQNKEARQLRVLQLRKMLSLLVHASECRLSTCTYPNCRKVKGLFRHGFQCKVRASGGCVLCKKMWYLLQLHARACKDSSCHVPRCNDLKDHVRRLQQQSESRRRAAVAEMMRQRAAEVSAK